VGLLSACQEVGGHGKGVNQGFNLPLSSCWALVASISNYRAGWRPKRQYDLAGCVCSYAAAAERNNDTLYIHAVCLYCVAAAYIQSGNTTDWGNNRPSAVVQVISQLYVLSDRLRTWAQATGDTVQKPPQTGFKPVYTTTFTAFTLNGISIKSKAN
jgi:hypothetical protein